MTNYNLGFPSIITFVVGLVVLDDCDDIFVVSVSQCGGVCHHVRPLPDLTTRSSASSSGCPGVVVVTPAATPPGLDLAAVQRVLLLLRSCRSRRRIGELLLLVRRCNVFLVLLLFLFDLRVLGGEVE